MKITHIGSVLMGHPHPWVFVKVHTDAGIVGIGEAYNGAGVHQVIADERFQSMLIGDNLRNVAQLFHRMMRWKASLCRDHHEGDQQRRVGPVGRAHSRAAPH